MKKTKFLSGVLALALTVTSISVASNGTGVDAAAKKPKLNHAKKTINVGDSFKISVKKVKGIKKITNTKWSTNKKKYVTLSKAGNTSVTVKGKAKGKSVITAKVTYKLKSSKKTAKLKCTVTVNDKKTTTAETPAATSAAQATAAATAVASVQATAAPATAAATAAATPAVTAIPDITPNPEYEKKSGYYAIYNGSKSRKGKDNLYINYVMANSKPVTDANTETNPKASVVESLKFKIDSAGAYEVGVYAASWEKGVKDTSSRSLNASNSKAKVGSFTTNGTVGQDIEVKLEGDAISKIDNERITFAFYIDPEKTPKELQGYCLYDMYVTYRNTDFPVMLTYNSVGCTGTAKGIFYTKQQDSSEITSDKYDSLYTLTEAKGYKFGTVIKYEDLQNEEFMKLVDKHCDSITANNEFKAYALLDQSKCKESAESADGMPVMNYERADAICKWAKDHNKKIRGHALVWDQNMSKWFFHDGYDEQNEMATAEVIQKRLESYIEQVIKHFETEYPGLVYCWDVVNEGVTVKDLDGIDGDTHYSIRKERDGETNLFYETLGYEYIKIAFEAARKTLEENNYTGIDLVYNDYNVIYKSKRDKIIDLVNYLNKDKKLVDTVGMQGYLGYNEQKNCLKDDLISNVETAIKELSSKAKVKVQLTEMAMRNFINTDEYMNKHAEFAKKLFSKLADINTPTNVFTSMSLWAFIDDSTLNYTDDEYEYDIYTPYSGLFDETYAAKDSFYEIYKAFGGTER